VEIQPPLQQGLVGVANASLQLNLEDAYLWFSLFVAIV
jgi:hypothetical protein